jgi:hypothetical protein
VWIGHRGPSQRYQVAFPGGEQLHVGNNHRGLTWFVDNDENWVNDTANVPAMEMVATTAEQYLRLNVVAKPVTISQPLHFRFYLLANPYKPLPKDWRTWVIANNMLSNEVSKHSKHRFWWLWDDYAENFKPYPGIGDPGKPRDPNVPRGTGSHSGSAVKGPYEAYIDLYKGKELDELLTTYNPRDGYVARVKSVMKLVDAAEPARARGAVRQVVNPPSGLRYTARLAPAP